MLQVDRYPFCLVAQQQCPVVGLVAEVNATRCHAGGAGPDQRREPLGEITAAACVVVSVAVVVMTHVDEAAVGCQGGGGDEGGWGVSFDPSIGVLSPCEPVVSKGQA
ncbi:hypothetical protein NDU88_002947 [Pleurodeles waltl]|uniref:Uncharacterized protein n=1 Tax=Pleurodeles waltl TaxID=8319 RepID=A0AAV7UYL3_PLEWA|nr:hypothetical protein NDU88_002947 [Pleurodeles waltl]